MRTQNISLFKKEIKEKELTSVLILSADDFERRYWMRKVVEAKGKNLFLSSFDAETHSLSDLVKAFSERSLWGELPLVLFDALELLKKKEEFVLLETLATQKNSGMLILGARERTVCMKSFLEYFEQQGLILDVSTEKPWEKKKRLSEFVAEKCAQVKKSIALSAIEKILETSQVLFALVEQEIDKLITYVGEKKNIQLEDVLAVGLTEQTESFWKLAEEIIWNDSSEAAEGKKIYEPSFFQGLLVALRHQMYMGLKLSLGEPLDTKMSYIPQKVLEKKKEFSLKQGPELFKRGLLCVFELEKLSKSQGSSLPLLVQYFYGKWREMKRNG